MNQSTCRFCWINIFYHFNFTKLLMIWTVTGLQDDAIKVHIIRHWLPPPTPYKPCKTPQYYLPLSLPFISVHNFTRSVSHPNTKASFCIEWFFSTLDWSLSHFGVKTVVTLLKICCLKHTLLLQLIFYLNVISCQRK